MAKIQSQGLASVSSALILVIMTSRGYPGSGIPGVRPCILHQADIHANDKAPGTPGSVWGRNPIYHPHPMPVAFLRVTRGIPSPRPSGARRVRPILLPCKIVTRTIPGARPMGTGELCPVLLSCKIVSPRLLAKRVVNILLPFFVLSGVSANPCRSTS